MTTDRTYNDALFDRYIEAAQALFDRAIVKMPNTVKIIADIEIGTVEVRMQTVLAPRPYIVGYLNHDGGRTELFAIGAPPVDAAAGTGV